MAKVICTLPNASRLINGVAFTEHDLGVVSEEIEQDVADAFLQINGYLDHASVKVAAKANETNSAATKSAPKKK